MYATLCDSVCIGLLSPFYLGFCLSVFLFFVFFSIVFSTCYHWWICLLVWLLSSFFFFISFLFFYFNNFFIFYFNNFIYLFFFCSFFFLTYLLSHVADTVLVLRPAVTPEPLRWESRVQDTGPPETSWLQVISVGDSSPTDLCLNTKTQLHSTTSKLQCWTPYAKQLARQEHNPTH